MLSSHSRIKGGPEPHLLTPLAYTGFWGQVQKAPYDHIVASLGQQAFVNSLPNKEKDYWEACRCYCDKLYSAYMANATEKICLDKTPEYATVWPFLTHVFPDAKYIVLTRHPAAIFDSFANSFFEGNHEAAHSHEPILERYVPAIAGFLRQTSCRFVHLRYEDLVAEPREKLQEICNFLDLPFEPQLIEYGSTERKPLPGLGDNIGVTRHSRPTDRYTDKWVNSMASEPKALALLQKVVNKLDPADLATIGFPLETFWLPLEKSGAARKPERTARPSFYRFQRKVILTGRRITQRSRTVRSVVTWLKLVCEVLLREY